MHSATVRGTETDLDKIIAEINRLLKDTTEDNIEAAKLLGVAFPGTLPNEKEWSRKYRRRCKLIHDEAIELRALGRDPWMTDPDIYKYFPPKRSLIIDIWKFLSWCRDKGKPEMFLERVGRGKAINEKVDRNRIREVLAEKKRKLRLEEAAANPKYQSGGSIITCDF